MVNVGEKEMVVTHLKIQTGNASLLSSNKSALLVQFNVQTFCSDDTEAVMLSAGQVILPTSLIAAYRFVAIINTAAWIWA